MAAHAESKTPCTDAQVVGNSFVDQYYLILQNSPELAYRFYQDTSVLGRPGPDGVMITVTTTQGINEKILSMDYTKDKVVILTSDAQMSYKDGVIVLVTGYITGEESIKRKFTQSFFLAPQNKGYFVLNDVFRYVDDHEAVGADSTSASFSDENPSKVASPPVPDPIQTGAKVNQSTQTHAAVNHTSSLSETDVNNKKEVLKPSTNEEAKVTEEEVVAVAPVKSSQSDVHRGAAGMSLSGMDENAPKKTFASIVSKLKENTAPFHVKVSLAKPKVQSHPSAPAESSASNVHNGPDKNQSGSVKSHSVFVGRLPLSATPAQLREAFERFGPIKPDGIQVRSNKTQGLCFGFVDFESSSSMEAALRADEVMVAGYRVNIEEAKKTRDNSSDKGRFPSGRGGFRNDNFRGRSNLGVDGYSGGGGRGYGRNDFEKRGEFSGHNRYNGEGGQSGDASRKGNLNGGGKGGR